MLPFLFVDNTKYLHATKTNVDQTIIQEDLNIASSRLMESNLSFNCNKCAVLHFWCNQETPVNYMLNNNPIDSRDSIKDLGITYQKAQSHISMVFGQKTLYFPGQITTPILRCSH